MEGDGRQPAGGRRALGLDRLGGAQVQALAARQAEVLVERLADEGVPERVGGHPGGAALAQDPGPQRLLHPFDQPLVVPARHAAQQGELELAAEYGGYLEQLDGGGGQARQAAGQYLAQPLGDAELLDGSARVSAHASPAPGPPVRQVTSTSSAACFGERARWTSTARVARCAQ